MVEGTPLLREHRIKNSIEGSNPSLSANTPMKTRLVGRFFILYAILYAIFNTIDFGEIEAAKPPHFIAAGSAWPDRLGGRGMKN